MPDNRRDGAAPSKRRSPSKKQIEAGKDNLAKGREAKAQKRAEAAKQGGMTAGEKWQMLLDGRLTVADLDDDEVSNMKVKSIDGTFNGRGRKLPSHLAQQFHQEAIKRANAQFRKALGSAVKTLADIAEDPDARESDRINASRIIIDRVLGKAVETVRIEDNRWDAVLAEAVGLDRDMADVERPEK